MSGVFLKLQLFVLHNTDTISFPLFTSRFLHYNQQKIIKQFTMITRPDYLIPEMKQMEGGENPETWFSSCLGDDLVCLVPYENLWSILRNK